MKRKFNLYTGAAIAGVALFGIVIASHGINGSMLFQKAKAGNEYALNLNASNRITSNISSATQITQRTVRGSEITFEYSNCNAENNYHAVINNGGAIINTNSIGGIDSITPVFTTSSGQLNMRAGYSSSRLGDYVILKSGTPFVFDGEEKPNFLEISASGGSVSLTSISYIFECSDYIEEAFQKVTSELSDYTGTYLIVDETDSVALKNVNSTSNTFDVSIKNNKILRTENTDLNELVVTKNSSKYIFTGKIDNGAELDYEVDENSGHLFWGSSTSTFSSSISYQNGLFAITASSHYLLYENGHFSYYKTSVSSGTRLVSLYKANFNSSGSHTVVYNTGITATDNKANTYCVGDTYDSFIGSKGLRVYLNKSGSGATELDSTQFTYEIKNGNATISSSSPFASTGTYTVNVYYNNYFSTSYAIIVNEAGSVSDDYTLVTDGADLQAGQSVLIVGIEDDHYYAMSKTQNNNNRGRVEISVTDVVADISDASDACEFELQAGTTSSTFAFYDSNLDGYIYAASSSGNQLKTQSTLSANSSFTISIDNSGVASVVAQGTNSNNVLQHNTSSDIFSCYGSATQHEVYLYAKGQTVAPQIPVESVSLSEDSLTFNGSGSQTLSATVLPSNATNKEVVWSSDDETVATVSQSGVVTAVGVGTTTITVASKTNSGATATCTVTVNPVAVTGVTLNNSSIELFVGDSSTLVATIAPSNATNPNVSWHLSDVSPANCVTLNNGTVSAVAAGSATVTVRTNDGNFEDSCEVTVNNRTVTSITFGSAEASVKVGKTTDLSVTISPSNATIKTLNWNSSDTSVAEITNTSDTGCTVRGVAAGTSTITATATDGSGVHGECTVNVSENSGIDTWTLVTNAGSLHAGDQLVMANRANNATAGGISSSIMASLSSTFNGTDSISELNEDTVILTLGGTSGAWTLANSNEELLGTTEAKKVGWDVGTTTWTISISSGDATISSTDSNCGRFLYNTGNPRFTTYTSATSSSMLLPQLYKGTSSTPIYPNSIEITGGESTIAASETTQLSVSFDPVTVNQRTVIWTSSNTSVATVNDGTVTGVSAGKATITAKAKASATDTQYTITDTFEVTVTPIASVSLDKSELNLTVGNTGNLEATVLPSNAPNKNITWSVTNASPNGCVSVANGVVTGNAEGTATVKAAASADSSKFATCAVTVTSSGGSSGSSEEYTVSFKSAASDGSSESPASTIKSSLVSENTLYEDIDNASKVYAGRYGLKLGSSSASGSFTLSLVSEAQTNITGIELDIKQYGTDTGTVDYSLGSKSKSFTPSLDGGTVSDTYATPISATTLTVSTSQKRAYVKSVTLFVGEPEPVAATDLSIPQNESVSLSNKNKTINVTYTPANANTGTEVTWSSSNTSVATINASSGVITPKATGTTTITARLASNTSITSSCLLTVTDAAENEWTILMYVCGADLESGTDDYGVQHPNDDGAGQASADIGEVLQVSGQPNDVKIAIQTGGAKAWKSTYSISSSNNQRYHVANRQLVKDNNKVYESYQGMGKASTLQDFIEWGLETYPAEKTGLILWNHGGGLDGVCYDEKDGDNSLTNNEVVEAVSGALSKEGLSKLEFIGYDACLMQMMEVAEFNSPYFNYQVGSQELENGTGWDYDTWVDDLYAKKSSAAIFRAIVDGFITSNGGVNETGYTYKGTYYPADQTLSYLDLSQMSAFKTAWEALAAQVYSRITDSNKSSFRTNVVAASKYFGSTYYTSYASFDCYDFLDKLEANSTFNPGGNYISNVRSALSNLVKYNVVQLEGAADAHGLSFYFGKTYNSSTYSNFSYWRSIISKASSYNNA